MIDVHCHLNEFTDFDRIAFFCEERGIKVISMTNRPSEFNTIISQTKKYRFIRAALGLHPMEVPFTKQELNLFEKLKKETSYIGEIGLDFSRDFIHRKREQLHVFDFILNSTRNEKKILSLHSRNAEKTVLENLIRYNIKNAIFHWYSGPLGLIDEIQQNGYYFSINPRMTLSEKGKKIIEKISHDKILVESDSPFIKINGKPSDPSTVRIAYNYLAQIWNQDIKTVERKVNNNLKNILHDIR